LEDFSKSLFEKLKEVCDSCKADTISLSGGLDSTILGYYLKEKKPRAVLVIAKDFPSNDLTYSQLASQELNLPLTIVKVSTEEILESITGTIAILRNFNDIEIRNNIVMYLTIKWVKDNDLHGIITGDGADEIFAGYSFLIQKEEDEIEREIQRIGSIMHFPAQQIGKAFGIKIESPFLDKKIIELANTIPIKLKVKMENKKKYGKWILRKTFENKIPFQIAWREKSPMQDGAGTKGLTNLFNTIISDKKFIEKKQIIEKESDIKIRSKESLHYFEIYKEMYGLSNSTKTRGISCPYCHFNTENLKFCRMCGAFPI
jgi:asparagine synthase (glutamine-hydrolysing)